MDGWVTIAAAAGGASAQHAGRTWAPQGRTGAGSVEINLYTLSCIARIVDLPVAISS